MADFFVLNRPVILFTYGQVFFILGLAIFLRSRRHSRLKLARDLRWLAAFGLLHGLHEWGFLFIPLQAEHLSDPTVAALRLIQVLLLTASFGCLLIFGLAALIPPRPILNRSAALLGCAWLAIVVSAYFGASNAHEWHRVSSIWARYLIGLPGATLAAFSLYTQAQTEAVARSGRNIYRMLQVAGASLLAYAFWSGMLVPAGSFFPANVLNQQVIEARFGIPVEVFRSLIGLFLTVSTIRALEIFEIEIDRRIEAMEVETIQADERNRIGQEIHDGAMQNMYSVGLFLTSMEKYAVDQPALSDRLHQAQQVLEKAILDLRRYMVSLRLRPPEHSLIEELQYLTAEPRFSSLIDVRLDLAAVPVLTPQQTGHLVGLTREALSNVIRHAEAGQATIRLLQTNMHFVLEISDNGQGFDEGHTPSGFGLHAMRDHARMLGSTLKVRSAPGKGTLVAVEFSEKDTL